MVDAIPQWLSTLFPEREFLREPRAQSLDESGWRGSSRDLPTPAYLALGL